MQPPCRSKQISWVLKDTQRRASYDARGGGGTMLTEYHVYELLQMVRTFYRGHLKTSNKKYADISVQRWKRRRRNQNAASAKEEIDDTRTDYWVHGVSYTEYGGMLTGADIPRAGNCGELAAVTAYYVNIHAPTLGCGPINCDVVLVGNEFHACVLLSDSSSAEGVGGTVQDIVNQGRATTGQWIIDAWLNVSCNAGDYDTQARIKLLKWHRQTKYIVEGGGPLHPILWLQTLLTSPMTLERQ
jgi:hypothetical protein